MSGRNPILCAIDTPDSGAAQRLAEAVGPFVGGIKLGLEFFTANGPEAVRLVAGAAPLLLDLKPHDIPNTVAGGGWGLWGGGRGSFSMSSCTTSRIRWRVRWAPRRRSSPCC